MDGYAFCSREIDCIELCNLCLQVSDFDSASEDDNDEDDSSGGDWETEEEELLTPDASGRLAN